MTSTDPLVATAGPAPLAFPPDFVWGAATAAYQVEGAASDGRTHAVDLGHLRGRPGPHPQRRPRPTSPATTTTGTARTSR